jgi:hypothetical protein
MWRLEPFTFTLKDEVLNHCTACFLMIKIITMYYHKDFLLTYFSSPTTLVKYLVICLGINLVICNLFSNLVGTLVGSYYLVATR